MQTIHPVGGIALACVAAGIRYRGRDDIVVISAAEGTRCAAVFTRNRFCAAPVLVAREHLAGDRIRALLINAGNANAGTGQQGLADSRESCAALAALLALPVDAVLPFSTGVIGQRLPVDRLVAALPDCVASLDTSSATWERAARAIMTTDTVPKLVSRQVKIGGRTASLTGMAKGAGMIRPDMATMLAFIATDAAVSGPVLDDCLRQAVARSFNRITVDGDTSTNDACVVLASGQAGNTPLETGDPEIGVFQAALDEILQDLAIAIIRDAEGATKFVTIDVTGGEDEGDCLAVAYTVAESPLVKTALFASDPNWGRILAAIGRAPVSRLEIDRVDITVNGVRIVSAGEPDPGYSETAGQEALRPGDIHIEIGLGDGAAQTTVWTSDLSHDYVRINAEYRS